MVAVTTPIEPDDLATLVGQHVPGAVLAFDVDGVLAPLVDHVEHSALTAGVDRLLGELAEHAPVALLSGRSLESLRKLLDFPPGVYVIGSHGLEVHGDDRLALSNDEQDVYDELVRLGRLAVDACGDGAWLEYKPASVVLHTRQAHGPGVPDAVGALVATAVAVPGVTVKAGHDVVEVLVRATDKGTALLELAARVQAKTLVFLGDDRTDEDAFTKMGPGDISVRVGPGDSVARFRLAGTSAVAEFLSTLTGGLATR